LVGFEDPTSAASDCTWDKRSNPPWIPPHLGLNIAHKACVSIHHIQGNAFWADAQEHDNQLQGNMDQRERMSWCHGSSKKNSSGSSSAPAQKKWKKWCFWQHENHCGSVLASRIPVHGTHEYTKPDHQKQISGSTVVTGVKNLKVTIDNLLSHLKR
jgi:hypothetical protein